MVVLVFYFKVKGLNTSFASETTSRLLRECKMSKFMTGGCRIFKTQCFAAHCQRLLRSQYVDMCD